MIRQAVLTERDTIDVMQKWNLEFDALLRQHCRFIAPDSPIDPDALLVTLGIDSLEVVEIIVAIEDQFDIMIPEEMLTPEIFATPGSIWQAISMIGA